jgi:protein TonB
MFKTLIASAPRRSRLLSSRTLTASLGAHLLLLGGAVYASLHPESAEMPEELVTYLNIREEIPAPTLLPPAAPKGASRAAGGTEPAAREERVEGEATAPAPEVARGFQELAAPEVVPAALPEIDPSLRAVSAVDFSGVGITGGLAAGTDRGERRIMESSPERRAAAGEPVAVERVEKRPRVSNEDEIKRLLRRLYPSILRDAGITGRVLLRFVVDTGGRVEPSSVQILSASHQAFGAASALAAERFRFSPARIGGRTVRVLVSVPIVWTLEDV